jgi:hypothetical protein
MMSSTLGCDVLRGGDFDWRVGGMRVAGIIGSFRGLLSGAAVPESFATTSIPLVGSFSVVMFHQG